MLVLTSIGISRRFSLSSLSKKGILILAFPITTFDFFLMPDMMNAISGGAFTYPMHSNATKTIITTTATTTPVILFSSFA